jgi:hypothetical protein
LGILIHGYFKYILYFLQAACGELKNVLTNVTKEQTSADVTRKSSGPFSHANLFRHT